MDTQETVSTKKTEDLVDLAAEIVSAYVSNNSVGGSELSELIAEVHKALKSVTTQQGEPEPEKREPAVSVKKSVQPDYIVSLFDGKKYKSLKRHIRVAHGMTPDAYRAYWGLPREYPMVAPNYAKARSELAKTMGLGQQRRKAPAKRGKKGA
jgi:predicted transcriptional regulator